MVLNSFRAILLTLALVLSSVELSAQRAISPWMDSLYVSRGTEGTPVTIPYREAHINLASSQTAVLAIYLHGHSGCGSDNRAQLGKPGLEKLTRYLIDSGRNAYVLAPQCTEDYTWSSRVTQDLVLRMIDEFLAEHMDIAEGKVYIIGDSMGAMGIWDILQLRPDFFAAAMPVSCVPFRVDASVVSATPICYVSEDVKNTRIPDVPTQFVREVRQAGGDIRFEELIGMNHPLACSEGFKNKHFDWIFNH